MAMDELDGDESSQEATVRPRVATIRLKPEVPYLSSKRLAVVYRL